MKTLVYDTRVDNAKKLVARNTVAAGKIRDISEVFQNVQICISRRFEVSIVAGRRNFEHLL